MNTLNYFQSKVEATLSTMEYLDEKKKSPEDFVLVDVRNAPPHIKKVKIENAVEIPLNDLENRLAELPKDKTIVVYCWDVTSNMAAHAAVILLKNGYKVKELLGGIAAWQSMNFPVEQL